MSLIERITDLGISDSMNLETRKRMRVVNQVSVLTLFSCIAIIVASFFVGVPAIGRYLMVSVAAVMLIPLTLNFYGRNVLSRMTFIIVAYINIICLSIAFGHDSHFQYYLIGGIGMPLLFFDKEIGKFKWLLSAVSPVIFLYLEWHYMLFQPFIEVDAESYLYLEVFNDLLVFLTVGSILAIFTIQHHQQIIENNTQKDTLESQSEQLSLAMASSRIAFWEWDLINEELIWDDQMFNLYGVKKEDFSGAYEAWSSGLHPDDSEKSQKAVQDALKGNEDFNTRFRVVHPDKSIHHISARGIVQRAADGKPTRMIGLNWDITQTMEHEALLSEQNKKLELVLSAGSVGVWEWDLITNELVWDNQMKLLYGISDEQFTGAYDAWTTGLHKNDRVRSEIEIQSAIKEGTEFNTKFRVVWPNKEIHHLRATGTIFRNDNGDPVRMIGLNWDVTKEQQIEQELLDYSKKLMSKNEELNEFTYIASHDLQEPINTITAFSDLLISQYGSKIDETGQEYLSYMKGSGERAKQLIADLLDYHRLGTDKSLKHIDLNALVNNVITDLKDSITRNDARVQIGGLPSINGYETELRQLFQNLIGNALKFSDSTKDSWVKVTAKVHPTEVEIIIEDNGIGIEEKYFDRIFAVFRRLHSKSEYAGTGIGLAHSKKITEMHEGRIWLESEIGLGSTFHFTISKNI